MPDFHFYSPEERIVHPLLSKKSVQLVIKRDDLIHPYISGNKWRKLKHIVIRAQEENKNHLVTFGGAWSNHVLAMACAGAKFGFATTAYIRGESVENPVLMLCRLFGMRLVFVDRTAYRDKEGLFDQYHSGDQHCLFVNEGGFSHDALLGCAEIIGELEGRYDHIFCACGTGATLAGLAKGLEHHYGHGQLHAIPVLKGGAFIGDDIAGAFGIRPESICWHHDHHFGGYGKVNAELLSFLQGFASHTGILLDPIYTGKLLYGLFDLIEKDYFKPQSTILALHTGGLTGLLGKQNEIYSMLR